MPPCGGDPVLKVSFIFIGYFNPRPHTGATAASSANAATAAISIHAPYGGDVIAIPLIFRLIFRSMPPYGGDSASSGCSRRIQYFNPRPLTGATGQSHNIFGHLFILIHAPSRGRQRQAQFFSPYGHISIHAPSRGRQRNRNSLFGLVKISIHAPSRGRQAGESTGGIRQNFNPRPLAGATACTAKSACKAIISIHAPSRGRLNSAVLFHALHDFNPRPLAGATIGSPGSAPAMDISIHAPSRGRRDTMA